MRKATILFLGVCTIWGGFSFGIKMSHIMISDNAQYLVVLIITILYLLSSIAVIRVSKKQKKSIAIIMSLIELILKNAVDAFEDLRKRDSIEVINPIKKIVNEHKNNVQTIIESELAATRVKLASKITKDFIKSIKDDPFKEYRFNNACKECIDVEIVEKSLRYEFDAIKIEIENVITDRLFGNGKLMRLAKYEARINHEFEELSKANNKIINRISRSILMLFYPKIKEIITPEHYKKILQEAYGSTSLSDLLNQQMSNDHKIEVNFDLSGWDIFALATIFDIGGINEIIAGSISDFLLNELHVNIGIEIAELIGLAIIDWSMITVVLKGVRLIRTLWKVMTHGRIDIDKILAEVNSGFRTKINGILNEESKKIEKSAISFIELMLQKTNSIYATHSQIMATYSKFIFIAAYMQSDEHFDKNEFKSTFA